MRQLVADAPLVLALQRLAFAALCSDHLCPDISVDAHMQSYLQDAFPAIPRLASAKEAIGQTWSWRDGGKSEQARLVALQAHEQAQLAAIAQKELDTKAKAKAKEAKAKASAHAEAKRKARDEVIPGSRRARKVPRKFE